VLTDDATFRDAGGNLTVPRSNFSVLRMKQDVLARSNVGLIFVNKQTDLSGASGWGNYNRAGGVDFSYSPTPALNVQGFVARTWDSDMTKGGNAFWGRFNYQGPVWEVRAVYQDVDDFFQPEAGYVNRRSGLEAFRRYEGRVRARPRPDISNIRYISTGPEFKVFTDRRNNVKFAEVELDLWTQFNTGDWYRTEVTWERDVVD
jgi:hypothetical protein